MVIDTTVFIDLFRGNKKASQFLLNSSESFMISRVVYMELLRGLKSKKDIKAMVRQLDALAIQIIEITKEISVIAGDLFEKHYHSHGLGIMDSLIAATAIILHTSLATHNRKHFTFIKRLKVIRPY